MQYTLEEDSDGTLLDDRAERLRRLGARVPLPGRGTGSPLAEPVQPRSGRGGHRVIVQSHLDREGRNGAATQLGPPSPSNRAQTIHGFSSGSID